MYRCCCRGAAAPGHSRRSVPRRCAPSCPPGAAMLHGCLSNVRLARGLNQNSLGMLHTDVNGGVLPTRCRARSDYAAPALPHCWFCLGDSVDLCCLPWGACQAPPRLLVHTCSPLQRRACQPVPSSLYRHSARRRCFRSARKAGRRCRRALTPLGGWRI